MNDWKEVLPGKWLSEKYPNEIILTDLNHLEIGKRYLLQYSVGYPGQEWINPILELSVKEFSPDKRFIKFGNGEWEKTKPSWSVKVLNELKE